MTSKEEKINEMENKTNTETKKSSTLEITHKTDTKPSNWEKVKQSKPKDDKSGKEKQCKDKEKPNSAQFGKNRTSKDDATVKNTPNVENASKDKTSKWDKVRDSSSEKRSTRDEIIKEKKRIMAQEKELMDLLSVNMIKFHLMGVLCCLLNHVLIRGSHSVEKLLESLFQTKG